MPRYRVQLPDGRVFEVQSPQPLSREEVLAHINVGGETSGALPTADNTEGPGFNPLDNPVAALLGAAAVGGTALALRRPGMAANALKRLLGLRAQTMLTGLAIPKAILGNVGGAAVYGAEKGTLAPLRQLLSRETLRDFGSAYRAGVPYRGTGEVLAPRPGVLPSPGRILGALDEAARKAVMRGGLSEEEALRLTFQRPITGEMGKLLESPAARYFIPFRRTPYNIFRESLALARGEGSLPVGAAAAGVGAVHGAATAEDRFPVSLGLGSAFSNRYAAPYLIAAALARSAAGGPRGAGTFSELLPVSEYGLESAALRPLQPFTRPAFLSALERISGAR